MHSAWYRKLDPIKKQAIRELHRVNPYWNFVGVLFAVLWIVVGVAVANASRWWVCLPGYVLIGVLIHGMANFMHEGIHGTLFKHKWRDRWYGFIMGAPALFSVSAYGVNHLLHHRHNRTEQDPDEFTNITNHRTLLSVFFYVWLVFGMVMYWFHVPYMALTKGSASDRVRVVTELAIMYSVSAGILFMSWQWGFFDRVAHVWLIPLIFAAMLGNIRGWAEHTLTVPGHPLTETRTVTSNRLFSFLNINLNYHLEHHLFPGVPWYNLPKVHRILLEDYQAAGSSIYRSYTRFLFDALRTGVHGLAPPSPGGRPRMVEETA